MDNSTQKSEVMAGTPSPERHGSLTIDPNDFEVRCILGTPCAVCGLISHILRKGGMVIEQKAEVEQATVIVWMLRKYAEQGMRWKTEVDKELKLFNEANT